jgi:hypothetical protein
MYNTIRQTLKTIQRSNQPEQDPHIIKTQPDTYHQHTPQPSTPIKHAGSEYLRPPEYKRQIKGMKTSRLGR